MSNLPLTNKEALWLKEKAQIAANKHNKDMKKYRTKLVPHPTQPKTWIEQKVLVDLTPKRKKK